MSNLRCLIVLCGVSIMCNIAYASEYPQTRDERRAEEIGSVLGGDGFVFRPGKIRNNSTKTDDSNVNSHLWNASKDIIEDIAPITFSDQTTGIMATGWYSNSKDTNRMYKLKIHITDDIISPESIKVELKHRVQKNGRWLEDKAPSKVVIEIEDQILRRARQLYLRKSK